tara:strand:+ start:1285 stop:1533 length:249 start_codon:yes stop_codon:yes gene_type:complete
MSFIYFIAFYFFITPINFFKKLFFIIKINEARCSTWERDNKKIYSKKFIPNKINLESFKKDNEEDKISEIKGDINPENYTFW